ncbi:helix-turn-helix domain-containing protein [Lolliginicoccus levis]|uniref:helix-turn-helix domain-containing protein n=1 Tax=Lolliginicoccus levis TaxID=2919542 RepID=UPI00241DA3A6|nr:helix-turn-helix transcriptional regulator [Lolliginicoccus levis]
MAEWDENDAWERLALILAARRRAMGFTAQRDLAARAQVSVRTISSLETAGRANYRDEILSRIENTLAWRQGSIRAFIATGVEPEEEPARKSARTGEAPLISTAPVLVPVDPILAQMQLVRRLHAMVDQLGPACPNEQEARDLARMFARNVTLLAGPYFTRLIEHNSYPGQSIHPLVEHMIAPYIDEPIPPDASPELRTEMLYRRWLAGRAAAISQQQEEDFWRRWRDARREEHRPF